MGAGDHDGVVVEIDLERLARDGGNTVILDLSTHEAIAAYNDSDLSTQYGRLEPRSYAYNNALAQAQVLVKPDPDRADWLPAEYFSQIVRLSTIHLSPAQQLLLHGAEMEVTRLARETGAQRKVRNVSVVPPAVEMAVAAAPAGLGCS